MRRAPPIHPGVLGEHQDASDGHGPSLPQRPVGPVATPLSGHVTDTRKRSWSASKNDAVVHGKVTPVQWQEADYYVDLRRVTLAAGAAPLVGRAMLDLTADLDYDAVGGLTLGADPVATAMLHSAAAGAGARRLRRAQGRQGHGPQRRIEGPDVAGRRVLAVEDTSTTGGSVLTAVEALREAGADVVGVAVIVERGRGRAVEAAGLPI